MNCPVCEEELEFRSSSRSPTKYARCPGCGTFINFSLIASEWLDAEVTYPYPQSCDLTLSLEIKAVFLAATSKIAVTYLRHRPRIACVMAKCLRPL